MENKFLLYLALAGGAFLVWKQVASPTKTYSSGLVPLSLGRTYEFKLLARYPGNSTYTLWETNVARELAKSGASNVSLRKLSSSGAITPYELRFILPSPVTADLPIGAPLFPGNPLLGEAKISSVRELTPAT